MSSFSKDTLVLIMCAGKGTRLLPLTKTTPKPLVRCLDVEILFWNIYNLYNQGLRNFVLNTHHLSSVFNEFLLDIKGVYPEAEFELSFEPELLGSGGTIINVCKKYDPKSLIVVNGDVISNIKLDDFKNSDSEIKVLVANSQDNYSKIFTDKKGNYKGVGFEAGEFELSYHNLGYYFYNSSAVSTIANLELKACSLFNGVYGLINSKLIITVHKLNEQEYFWFSVENIEELEKTQEYLLKNQSQLVRSVQKSRGIV